MILIDQTCPFYCFAFDHQRLTLQIATGNGIGRNELGLHVCVYDNDRRVNDV